MLDQGEKSCLKQRADEWSHLLFMHQQSHCLYKAKLQQSFIILINKILKFLKKDNFNSFERKETNKTNKEN